MTKIKELKEKLYRLDRLNSVSALLGWDEQVNLPNGSVALRGEQNAFYGELIHREASSPELGDLINSLYEDVDTLEHLDQIIVKEAKKDYDRLVKIPSEFVQRKAKASSASFHAWGKAREANSFNDFAPHLEKQIDLAKEEAGFLEAENSYDYWIDQFDPGMTAKKIESLFVPLEKEIRPILNQILNSKVKANKNIFKNFPNDKQELFLREVVKDLGFDFNRGRIDVAVHPFCGGHPRDTRMTTRYDKNNPIDSISSAMHETGHALYEQGLRDDFAGTALGHAVGMAVHESQSRLWENQIGRHPNFWKRYEPRYRELFGKQLNKVSSEQLYLAINDIGITPIRVDADEVTYNLHIMLRFQLEKALFSEALGAKDLPNAWNEMSERILGYLPKSDAEGCLQDVHWSEGLFGYFPSYCLGNVFAAQLWYKLLADSPNMDEVILKGEYSTILDWLRKNIHFRGREFYTDEMAKIVTGSKLDPSYLIQYLKERYLPLYTAS